MVIRYMLLNYKVVKMKQDEQKIYAALKLIEYLYKQQKISKYIFINIINEYKNKVDISDFQCYTNK